MGPLNGQNAANPRTKAEDTRGPIARRRPDEVHFPLQFLLFSSLKGTKPHFSYGKFTLGPHAPPHGATLVVKIMLQIAIQTKVTLCSAASELCSALPVVTSDAPELSSGASKVSSDASELSYDAPEHRSYAS